MKLKRLLEALPVSAYGIKGMTDDKYTVAVMIKAMDFLKLTTSSFQTPEDIMQYCKSYDEYSDYIGKQVSYDSQPFLKLQGLDGNENKPSSQARVIGHEGRHRIASVVCRFGEDKPVQVMIKYTPNDGENQYIYQKNVASLSRPEQRQTSGERSITFDDIPNLIFAQYDTGYSITKNDLQLVKNFTGYDPFPGYKGPDHYKYE